ncbi:MAG: thioredoxin family protein [Chitinophagales bacterium]
MNKHANQLPHKTKKNSWGYTKRFGICIGILLFFISTKATTQNQEVYFLNTPMTMEQLVLQAKKEHKLIFIYVFEANSPTCAQIENYLFKDSQIAAYHNRNFINYKIDGKIDISQSFVAHFQVTAFPSFLFFSEKGQLLYNTPQKLSAMDYLKLLENIHDTSNSLPVIEGISSNSTSKFDDKLIVPSPDYNASSSDNTPQKSQPNQSIPTKMLNMEEQVKEWQKSYYNKTIGEQELLQYAYWLRKNRQSYHSIVNEYLKTQRGKLQNNTNRQFLYDFSETIENEAIKLLINDIQYFKATQGSEKINQKIKTAIYNSIQTAIKEHDKIIFKNAIDIIHQTDLPFQDAFEFDMKKQYYEGVADWKAFAETAIEYIDSKNITDPILLIELAAKVALHLDDSRYLENALKWAETSVKIENEYPCNYTLAYVYYRKGDYDMAMKVAEYTLKLAEMRQVNSQEIKKLIDDIRIRQK